MSSVAAWESDKIPIPDSSYEELVCLGCSFTFLADLETLGGMEQWVICRITEVLPEGYLELSRLQVTRLTITKYGI